MNKSKDKWAAPQAKTIRSVNLADGAIFIAKPKPNPYIRSATYLKAPSINTKGWTNSEAY